jgi:hypothetical protein
MDLYSMISAQISMNSLAIRWHYTAPWGRGPAEPLLPTSTMRNFALATQRDLARADIPSKGRGGTLEFHSLRVTFITLALEAGANPKEVMDLARHKTVDMTFRVYAMSRWEWPGELAEAVGQMVKPGRETEKSVQASVQAQAVGAERETEKPLSRAELRGKQVWGEGGGI